MPNVLHMTYNLKMPAKYTAQCEACVLLWPQTNHWECCIVACSESRCPFISHLIVTFDGNEDTYSEV